MNEKTTNRLKVLASNDRLVREKLDDLMKYRKRELAIKMISTRVNYDRLREFYLDRCIEIEYMKRRIKQLEDRVELLNVGKNHRSFRDIDKTLKKNEKKERKVGTEPVKKT